MTTAFRTVPLEGVGDPTPLDPAVRELSQNPAAVAARQRRAEAKARGETPKRRTAKPRKSAPRGPKSLAPEISAFLSMANMLVIMTPLGTRPVDAIYDPSVIPERVGDELDAAEINALASALDAQCRRSVRFRKYVERVLGAGSGGTLFAVVGMIAARRAARHHIIPNGDAIDFTLGGMLAGDMLDFTPPAPPDTTPDPITDEVAPDRTGIDFDNIEGEDGGSRES